LEKLDFKKEHKELYAPPKDSFVLVAVPRRQFLMVDGEGDPNTSTDYLLGLSWLYSVAYALKFASKAALGRDYTIPPLEALWWADDMAAFARGDKQEWRWTQALPVPEFISRKLYDDAVAKSKAKLGDPPASLRMEPFDEGLSVQILHVGAFADEAPTIARLHAEFLPQHQLAENGHHHEIYLSDPRRTAPDKLRTILRQPVKHAV
jgi:hypothetical protein